MSLARQVQAKMLAKRDLAKENEALEWISAVLGETYPTDIPEEKRFHRILHDGQVLCRLINKLAPGSVSKVNTSGSDFKLMENVNNFLKAIRKYGVPDVDIFQTVDLWEGKDLVQVVGTLFALGRTTYKHPDFSGPYLGPKPSEESKRDFSEEQLAASKNVIGLQAGSNKGATQAGQNIGASRKVILGK